MVVVGWRYRRGNERFDKEICRFFYFLCCVLFQLLRLVFAQGTDLSQQEDVSEFTHKLLEWIEDAFTMSLPKTE